MNKRREFSFPLEGKESLEGRIKILIGSRSVRTAAKDWGVAYSTLNNYITRGTIPALNIAHQICEAEGVRLDWLATGKEPIQEDQNEVLPPAQQTADKPLSDNLQKIISIISMLENDEQYELARVLMRKGAEIALLLTNETNIKLMQIPENEKQAIMRLSNSADPEVTKILRQLVDDGCKQLPGPIDKKAG